MATKRQTREPYDPVKVIHDSFETYAFEPDKEERDAFRNRRRANDRLRWLERRKQQWAAEDAAFEKYMDSVRKRRAQEISAAVKLDKVILAAEREFEQRIKKIQAYYEKENQK